MRNKRVYSLVAIIVIIAALVLWCVNDIRSQTNATQISVSKAQEIVNSKLDAMATTKPLQYIAGVNEITVKEMSYGNKKDVILNCSVKTIDTYGAVSPVYNDFLSADAKKTNGSMFKSTLDFKLEFEDRLVEILKTAQAVENKTTIILYETDSGFVPFADDDVLNAVFGGTALIECDVMAIKTVTKNGAEQKIESTNINKGLVECFEARATSIKPETAHGVLKLWNSIKQDFTVNFLKYNRWKTIFKGLWVTIKLTFFALLIGLVLGFIVAFVRCTYLKTTKHSWFLKLLNSICQVYLTVIRGTPAVIQIMFIYFVIFMPLGVDKFISAVVCFGLNSGAYVAEIVRGGIMNVDDGQTEAGRSLGFNYSQTMSLIVLPQAFKAVLPALANEFVVLLKETSVAFYIGLGDVMYAGNAIRSATYSPFMPLIAVALIYLVMVLGLSKLVSMLERRLRTNER